MSRLNGTVKWFNDAKGYGFLTPSDGGRDIFVHYTDIVGSGHKSLKDSDPVSFEMGQSGKGPKAINVQLATAACSQAS